MSVSVEMLWNRINAIGDEVHSNALETVKIKTKLDNHLEHEKTNTNKKIAVMGMVLATLVGLLAIFK